VEKFNPEIQRNPQLYDSLSPLKKGVVRMIGDLDRQLE